MLLLSSKSTEIRRRITTMKQEYPQIWESVKDMQVKDFINFSVKELNHEYS